MPNLSYEIGDGYITTYADISATICGSVPTTYSISEFPTATWLIFDALTTYLYIYTLDVSHVNTYYITITASVASYDHGSLTGISISETFELSVTNVC